MKTKHCLLQGLLAVLLLSASLQIQAQNNINNLKIGPQPDGSILVPSNQLLRPAGFQLYMPGRPVDISLISNERFLLVKNMNSLDLIQLNDRSILQTLPYTKGGSSFTGICSSKDNRRIYVSEASEKILIARFDQSNVLSWEKPILMPKPAIGGDPGPGGLALNAKEDRLYVTLSRNNS
ncbi:MAG TPA: hypothetical protein VFC41_00510, partial [Anaerovoracaceae bacterium]|nr:hypothetical protein [Anaerovoracaceae bacterium]